jgi:hypothetical protein
VIGLQVCKAHEVLRSILGKEFFILPVKEHFKIIMGANSLMIVAFRTFEEIVL